MNVVFAGYRKWSLTILKKLLKEKISGWKVTGVISIPRSEKEFNNLSVPALIHDPRTESKKISSFLKKCDAQICLFYGWSWIIPKEIYRNYLSLILHPSPLPKYRGGSPLQHQIIAGEKESTVTILQAGGKIDAGDIYSQTPFSLDGSLDEIFARITTIGVTDTRKILGLLAKEDIFPFKQDEEKATYFKRRLPSESEITIEDLKTKTSKELYDFVRALTDPYPNAFIKCSDGNKLFIKKVEIES